MSSQFPCYGTAEDPNVSVTLAEAIAADPRVDEVFLALTWRLGREPHAGTEVEYEGVIYREVILRSIKESKNPTIAARYSVDDSIGLITIHAVKVYPYDDATAYSPIEFGDN